MTPAEQEVLERVSALEPAHAGPTAAWLLQQAGGNSLRYTGCSERVLAAEVKRAHIALGLRPAAAGAPAQLDVAGPHGGYGAGDAVGADALAEPPQQGGGPLSGGMPQAPHGYGGAVGAAPPMHVHVPGAGEQALPTDDALAPVKRELRALLASRQGRPLSIAQLPDEYAKRYGRSLAQALQVPGSRYTPESARGSRAGGKAKTLGAFLREQLTDTVLIRPRPHGQHEVVLAPSAGGVDPSAAWHQQQPQAMLPPPQQQQQQQQPPQQGGGAGPAVWGNGAGGAFGGYEQQQQPMRPPPQQPPQPQSPQQQQQPLQQRFDGGWGGGLAPSSSSGSLAPQSPPQQPPGWGPVQQPQSPQQQFVGGSTGQQRPQAGVGAAPGFGGRTGGPQGFGAYGIDTSYGGNKPTPPRQTPASPQQGPPSFAGVASPTAVQQPQPQQPLNAGYGGFRTSARTGLFQMNEQPASREPAGAGQQQSFSMQGGGMGLGGGFGLGGGLWGTGGGGAQPQTSGGFGLGGLGAFSQPLDASASSLSNGMSSLNLAGTSPGDVPTESGAGWGGSPKPLTAAAAAPNDAFSSAGPESWTTELPAFFSDFGADPKPTAQVGGYASNGNGDFSTSTWS